MTKAPLQTLPFTLHDFTRLAWVSDAAREVWGPRLSHIIRAWRKIEVTSVKAGLRNCALVTVSSDVLPTFARECLSEGFALAPLVAVGVSNDTYASTMRRDQSPTPPAYTAVVGRFEHVRQFEHAYSNSDEAVIGEMLGFPNCCVQFYLETWVKQRLVDGTWSMACRSRDQNGGGPHEIEVGGKPEANILWRWAGVRAATHLPCSFDCEATAAVGERMLGLARSTGESQAADWIQEVLSWPVEWSALHGIAEIKTPILKIMTRTDATAQRYTVRRQGTQYPELGATGLGFAYKAPVNKRLVHAYVTLPTPDKTVSRERVLISLPEKPAEQRGTLNAEALLASQNGFSSKHKMDAAHAPIVGYACALLSQKTEPSTVVDLGAGNGLLLKKICSSSPNCKPFAVEADQVRGEAAQRLLEEQDGVVYIGNMFNLDAVWTAGARYTAALLMVGRLLEVDAARAKVLLRKIFAGAEHLIIYAYDDARLRRGQSLEGVAERAGLRLAHWVPGSWVSEAVAIDLGSDKR